MTRNCQVARINLEHILPQNYESFGSAWKKDFSKGVDPDDFTYRIGNLTLLMQKVNSDDINDSFTTKKELAFKNSDLVINSKLATLSKWGEQEIENRQAYMAKIALDVWKLK
jgi:Protein of unknown function (DUF1524)